MSNAFKDCIIANMPPTDEIDGMAEEHERLKKELAELPKKICDEIKNSAAYLSSGFFRTRLKIDLYTLDAIQEKYTKGETK